MNWKLIPMLSLFGLAMAFATVYGIPSRAEPFFWVPVFMLCAYFIARYAPKRYFLHGFLTGLLNCVWVTAAHVRYAPIYLAHHTKEAEQYVQMAHESGLPVTHAILLLTAFIGTFSAVVLGLFSHIAGRAIMRGLR